MTCLVARRHIDLMRVTASGWLTLTVGVALDAMPRSDLARSVMSATCRPGR